MGSVSHQISTKLCICNYIRSDWCFFNMKYFNVLVIFKFNCIAFLSRTSIVSWDHSYLGGMLSIIIGHWRMAFKIKHIYVSGMAFKSSNLHSTAKTPSHCHSDEHVVMQDGHLMLFWCAIKKYFSWFDRLVERVANDILLSSRVCWLTNIQRQNKTCSYQWSYDCCM